MCYLFDHASEIPKNATASMEPRLYAVVTGLRDSWCMVVTLAYSANALLPSLRKKRVDLTHFWLEIEDLRSQEFSRVVMLSRSC